MGIRNKLVIYFLVVAALVPVLGGAALSRIRDIDRSVQNLSDNAIPRTNQVQALTAVQRDQQAAALAYVAGGKAEDRQRYLDLSPTFDARLVELSKANAGSDAKEKEQAVAEARAKFNTAGAQLVQARQTRDKNLDNLKNKRDEIVKQLTSIRARFVPNGQSGVDGSGVPTALRYQINDLLLGTEGMLNMVSFEQATASDYTIMPDDKLRQQFDSAGTAFNGWLQIAYNAGGTEDRQILGNVQKSFGEFESSARAMMAASDLSAKSLGSFVSASADVQNALGGYVTFASDELTAVRKSSSDTVGGAQRMILVITVAAFVFAGCLGAIFASKITLPIRRLRDVADRVSRGDVEDVDIDVDSKDEIGDLADAFRRMVASVRFLMMRGDDDEQADDTFDFPQPLAS